MRVLKLYHPLGHPYWQADEYRIELPTGEMYDKTRHEKYSREGYRILVRDDGIYYQPCGCGSGYGKVANGEPVKIINNSEYDAIEYIGKELVMSQTLINDLKENELL